MTAKRPKNGGIGMDGGPDDGIGIDTMDGENGGMLECAVEVKPAPAGFMVQGDLSGTIYFPSRSLFGLNTRKASQPDKEANYVLYLYTHDFGSVVVSEFASEAEAKKAEAELGEKIAKALGGIEVIRV